MKVNFPAILLTAAVLVTVAGCSRLYRFEGTIKDAEGNPISGAMVFLHPSDWPDKEIDHPTSEPVPGSENVSDVDGKFKAFWGNAVGVKSFRMVVVKIGYEDAEQTVAADEKGINVVLKPESETTKSTNAG